MTAATFRMIVGLAMVLGAGLVAVLAAANSPSGRAPNAAALWCGAVAILGLLLGFDGLKSKLRERRFN